MEATYKLFTSTGDRTVKVEDIPALLASKEIRPDTRIFNNETKSWTEFKHYKHLHGILSTLPPMRSITDGTQSITDGTYRLLLDEGVHDLSMYRIERLVEKGRITPETKIFAKETDNWVPLKEYAPVYQKLQGISINPSQQENKAGSEYLQECLNCHHQYSKRADKCPKCGNAIHMECNICKRKIPRNSTSCPECGDPEPFVVSVEQPSVTPAATPETQSAVPKKDMNPLLRWGICIVSFLGVMFLFAAIHTYREDAGYRGKPMGLIVPPLIASFVAYRLTKPKRNTRKDEGGEHQGVI